MLAAQGWTDASSKWSAWQRFPSTASPAATWTQAQHSMNLPLAGNMLLSVSVQQVQQANS